MPRTLGELEHLKLRGKSQAIAETSGIEDVGLIMKGSVFQFLCVAKDCNSVILFIQEADCLHFLTSPTSPLARWDIEVKDWRDGFP